MKKAVSFFVSVLVIVMSLVVCYFVFTSRISSTSQYLDVYQQMIDMVVENDTDVFKEAEYLAIDASSFYVTTEKEKQDLIKYLKKYNSTILIANYDMLDNKEFAINGTLNGILISANSVEKNGNKVTVSLKLLKDRSDAKTITFEGTHFNGKWKLKQSN